MSSAYTIAIFLSALLLFLIQPMVAKHLVPVLGGAPAVWNTAMVFFQAVLLVGYLYAHITTRLLGPRRQPIAHFVLLALSLLWLPLAIRSSDDVGAVDEPVTWLLRALALSVGVPFLALSANSPAIQAWFSRTSHPHSHNPYFLYSASNLGSMVALLAYPVLVEPTLRLGQQRALWSALYALLLLLLAGCVFILWRSPEQTADGSQAGSEGSRAGPLGTGEPAVAKRIDARRRGSWILFSFVPSSLLLGTTTYITTDLASVPLLWTIPLALYLLSSVLVFARRPILYPEVNGFLLPLTVALAITLLFDVFRSTATFVLLPLAVLFVASMVCHGRLAEDRPPAEHLTEFYFWLSAGGVLGGAFNAFLAPAIFDSVWEYPIALVLACLLRPADTAEVGSVRDRLLDVALPTAVLVAMALFSSTLPGTSRHYLDALSGLGGWLASAVPALGELGFSALGVLSMCFYAVPAIACVLFWRRPRRFVLMLGGILFIGIAQPFQTESIPLHKERNFFGSLKVTRSRSLGLHYMYHGTTLHGLQPGPGGDRLRVTSFYRPLGQLWSVLPPSVGEAEVAVVGLGAGTAACIGDRVGRVTFFEINPAVEAMARNPKFFTYLRDCPPSIDVVLGDARVSLTREPDGRFDVLVLDAFSSDSVPVHLVTREAMALYRSKVASDGVLAFHVSSWHLNFIPVLAALAEAENLHGVSIVDREDEQDPLVRRSKWVVLSSTASLPRRLQALDGRWEPLPPASAKFLWTDDFSNIFSILE